MTRFARLQHPAYSRVPAALSAALLLTLAASATPAEAQRQGGGSADLSTAGLLSGVEAREIGPAAMSGRVTDIAVAWDPSAPAMSYGTHFYIAAASGGVWKTTNGGISYEPVFDETGIASIGDIAVAPSNHNIVYVGTGEANS